MDTRDAVAVAGPRGLVGSALMKRLAADGRDRVLPLGRAEADLRDSEATRRWFLEHRPSRVYVAAAVVGGIQANLDRPVEFLRDNLLIVTSVMEAARISGVKRLLFLGSSCIYPREAAQPIREDALLTGPLEPSNEPYALAKIAGVRLAQAYRRQYGCSFISAMPANLYGPGDNFDLRTSHVLPAMIRRFHEAGRDGAASVQVWGTGTPRREFLHVDDLADALVFLMDRYDGDSPVNVGTGADLTIADLAAKVRDLASPGVRIEFDPTRPDGAPRKLLDISRLAALGWRPRIPLEEGIRSTLAWYRQHIHHSRDNG